MRHDVDVRRILPALLDRVIAIRFVEEDQPIGGARRGGDLREAHGRMKQPARPRLANEASGVVVQHPAVIQVLESVGAGDHDGTVQAAAAARRQPEALGTGDVDDVIRTVAAEQTLHRVPGNERTDGLPHVRIARSAEAVREQDVTGVPHRLEFLAQLQQDLRRSEPGIRRVVADQENAHASIRLSPP